MTDNTPRGSCNNIQYPETRIQDQLILAIVFIVAVKFDYKISCNYRIYGIHNAVSRCTPYWWLKSSEKYIILKRF
jgi:hypothetical protein